MDLRSTLPQTIRLGLTRYTIACESAEWRSDNEADGMSDFKHFVIHLVTEGRPLSEIYNTLIHELLHVCYREWHIKPRCSEEHTVTSLGFALASLYAQNPPLLQAMLKISKELAKDGGHGSKRD